MSFPRRTSAVLTVWAALLSAPAWCFGQEQKPIPLEDAVRQGLVKVDVTSYGGAYGDAMEVAVQRLVSREVHVVVEPGTVFVSVGGDVQNMVGRRVKGEMVDAETYRATEVMVLADGARRSFLVEAYCLDYEKPEPRANNRFRLAARDPRAARILVNTPLAKVDVSVGAIQSALWMDRAGVSGEELQRRYPFTAVDVQVAGDLLKRVREIAAARIPPGFAPEVRVQVEGLLSPDPAVRIQAARRLSAMGPGAALAIPFLQENSLAVRPLRPAPAPKPTPAPKSAPAPKPAQPDQAPEAPEAPEGVPPAAPEAPAPGAPGTSVRVEVGSVAEAVESMIRSRPIEPLLASLSSPRPLLRRHAARTLGLIGDPRAVPKLIIALKDTDERVQELAEASLKEITKQDFGRDRVKWLTWWEKNRESFLPKESPQPKE